MTPATIPASAKGQTWVAHLARHAHAKADVPALRWHDTVITWAQLADRVLRVGSYIGSLGISRGDRVGIVMGNRPEYLEALLAINAVGAIAVPVNPRLSAEEIGFILRDSGSAMVMTDGDFNDVIARAAGEESVTVVDLVGVHGQLYRELLVGADSSSPAEDLVSLPIGEADPALIMYTSGTTGSPKGAVLTHRNLMAQSQTNLIAFRFRMHDEIYLCASPLFHIGAIGGVAPALLVGATIVIMPTGAFDAGEHLDVMATHQITSTFLVPAQWQAIVTEQQRRPRDLSHLRVAAWGAAPASVALLRQMIETLPQADALALFGQTEMSPVTCVLEGKYARSKLGSVGRPAPGVWVRVVDPNMNDLAPGQVGEIVYRGPGLMDGYWNRPDATAEAFSGGWFHSGDLVRVDDEGFIYVVDRLKDMVISGGENVYCAEVENVLASHPDIAEVAVIGRPHSRWGETPVAVVVPGPGAADLTLESVREFARASLASFKLPTGIELVEVLPRNASGKVLKHKLRGD